MTKKLNSFKNIISVLLALLLLGIAAGPASAIINNVTIYNNTSTNMEYGNGINISAIADGSNMIYLVLNVSNTSFGNFYINVTNTTQNVTIGNLTTYAVNFSNVSLINGTNVTINLTSTARIPSFNIEVKNMSEPNDIATSTNLSFIPATVAGNGVLNNTTYKSGDVATATITDSMKNLNSTAIETFTNNVTSSSNSTGIELTFTETGADTGIFTTTTFTFAKVGAAAVLQIADNGTVYLNYSNDPSNASVNFNAIANTLNLESVTYGNLTTMNNVTVTPASMVAGVATVFKINATDATGILDTNFTGVLTATVNGSATRTPSSYTFVAADSGAKNISVTDNVAEGILVKFNSSSITNTTSEQTVVPNRPYKLLFNSSMPLSTLGNTLQVNISVADAYNNLVNPSKFTGPSYPINATQLGGTDGLGLGINFNVTLGLPTAGAAGLNTTSVLMWTPNVDNYVAFVNDTTDETVVLSATASYFEPTEITTSLSFLGAVSNLLVYSNKTSPVNTANANGGANGLGKIILSAQLRDASNNALTVPGSVVTFTSNNTTVLDIVGQTNTTNASGIALITVSTTTSAGVAKITAADATGHLGSVIITTTAVVDSALSTLNAVNVAPRAGDNVTVYATLKDYAGTAMPAGTTVSFNITTGDATSTLNGVAKTTIVTAVTNSTGVATVGFRATNGTGPYVHTINATVVDELGASPRVGATELTITVSPNDPTKLVVLPASKGLANIKGTNATFNFTLYDAYDNINTTNGVKVNISTSDATLGNMTTGSTVSTLSTNYVVNTTAAGVGSMLYKINSTAISSATLTFAVFTNETGQVAGLTNFTKTVFVTTSGATLVSITPSVTGAAVNNYITLTVNLTDNDGNLIGIDGTAINLIASGGASLNLTTLLSVGGTNNTNLTSSTAGPVTVTAYVEGLSPVATTVTFSGNATKFVMTPVNSSLAVNGTTNITIQAYDALNNKAAIYNGVSISTQTGVIPAVSSLITVRPTSFTFNATGYAMINVTSATVGTYTIEAVALGLVNSTSVTFTEAEIPALTVAASPANVTVGTATNVTFTVTPALSGVLVTLSGAGVSMSDNTTNGTVTMSVTATSAGTITATASKSGYTAGSTTIAAAAAPGTTLTISANHPDVRVGVPEDVTFTVTPALSDVLVTLSGAGVSTSANTTSGTVTINVNATSVGTITATASKSGYTSATTTIAAEAEGTEPALVSSITPNSRNAQVGTPVTIFMSVINYGTATATGVSITQASGLAATVSYQQWNGSAFIGTADTPADIAAGATANYVLTINATAAFTTSSLTFTVASTNGATAPISAVNTLTIAASVTPSADVIMMSTNMNISATLNNWKDLAVATTNVGADATGVSFNVVVPSSITGLITLVNETNPDGSIKGPATGLTINAGQQPTFAVFVYPTTAIAFNPTDNRITLELTDGTGKVIGAQSVAISTT